MSAQHNPITRATCWSVRQCTERAASLLNSSHESVAQLDALLDDMLGITPRCNEHQAVITQLDHLHTLVEHCIVNLRSGFAAPATPTAETKPAKNPGPAASHTASPPRKLDMAALRHPSQNKTVHNGIGLASNSKTDTTPPPEPLTNTVQLPSGLAGGQASANNRAEIIRLARAEGLLDIAAVAQAGGFLKTTIQQYRSAGRLPKEHTTRRGVPFWLPEQVAHIKRKRGLCDAPKASA